MDITDTCLNSRLCCGQAWASAPRISSWNHCYFHISWEHVKPNTLNYVQAIVNLSHLSHVVACLAIATGVKTQWHLLAWATPTWRRHHETCVRQKKHVPIFLRPGPSTCIKLPHHLSRHSCIWVGIWDQDDLSLYKKHCNPLYQPGVTVWFLWSVSIARVDSGRLCRPVDQWREKSKSHQEPIDFTRQSDALLTSNPEKSRTYWRPGCRGCGPAGTPREIGQIGEVCYLEASANLSKSFRVTTLTTKVKCWSWLVMICMISFANPGSSMTESCPWQPWGSRRAYQNTVHKTDQG